MSSVAAAKKAETKPAADEAPGVAGAIAPITALLSSQWKPRESGVYFTSHEICPDAGTPKDNLLRPDFWANVSQKFRPGDTLLVWPRDGAYYAELLVWDAGQNWANVTVKGFMERPEFDSAPGLLADFEVRRDPIEGYVAIRKSSGAKLKGGFANAEDARRWFLEHQRVLKR